ncbi:MAG: ABC transporter permease [Actinomycetota bacterium]|nr:ABC transporter permease [Actinomycetota bacterium]
MNVTRIETVIRRHGYVLWRSPNRWFDIAFFPVMDVILFGSLGTYAARQSHHSGAGVSYLLAGIMLFHVLFQVQVAMATGFMEETWSRNLLNVMVTPVTEIEYVAGLAVFGLFKLTFALLVLSAMALAFFGFGLGQLGVALIPICAILIAAGWAIALLVIGMMLRFGQSAEILTYGLNFMVLALSGVFYPVNALPGVIQPLARALPTTHAFIAMRSVLAGHGLPTRELLSGAAGTVVLMGLAFAFVVHMLRVFRRKGLVTRFS